MTPEQRAAIEQAVKALGDGFSPTGHKMTRKSVPVFDEFDEPWQDACTCGGYLSYPGKKCTREAAAKNLLSVFELEAS